MSTSYPFAAIVGQERLTQALLLNAVHQAVGGVVIAGPSGTGKSTAVRGLAALLPELDVVGDCPFSCDPVAPCTECAARVAAGETLPVVRRRMRIVTLPLNATEDRVAGSLDIARALREGVAALEPGLLAEANRGILYVDEINLLDDHLVDVLLDAAAMGVNVVEREGVSVEHPARFLLVGTMNPEEGDLRPQIADRIGLQVEVSPLTEAALRVEVLKRREAFSADPGAFVAAWAEPEAELAARVARARVALSHIVVPDTVYAAIVRLAPSAGVGSHRADVTILECAKALAALEGAAEVGRTHVLEAAGLALSHRVTLDPFGAGAGLDDRLLRRTLDDVLDVETAEKKAVGPA
ncbi:MAG: magnesium chelatase ATPase subunit I [Thermoleophilia bacterium]|nr:magnesium chelatase ATPase subunit I [Thermoleophilia bacterium]